MLTNKLTSASAVRLAGGDHEIPQEMVHDGGRYGSVLQSLGILFLLYSFSTNYSALNLSRFLVLFFL